MLKRIPLVGEAYKAQTPIEFWSKWLPGNPFSKIYKALGGYQNYEKAVSATFLAAGIFHDLFVNGVIHHMYGDENTPIQGVWTLWFAVQGLPVALQKAYYQQKAKQLAGKELDALVDQYSTENPEQIVDGLSAPADVKEREGLEEYIKNYDTQRTDAISLITTSSNKYMRQALFERRNKTHIIPDIVRKPLNTLLTGAYVVGSWVAIHEGLNYLYDKLNCF